MNKQLLLIILLLLQTLSVFIPSTASAEWIIDGDTVYVDNAQAYLSVTPHTVIESEEVTFHLKSKQYSGDIDAIWLFNTSNCRPKKPVYVKVGEGNWSLLSKDIIVENISYQGYNKAYMLESVNINQDVDYYLRCPMEVKFNSSGKYWFGIRKTGDPISQGLWLDPWFNNNWSRWYPLTIDKDYIDTTLTNFPIRVEINSTIASYCQAGGEDIRFVALDNTTVYNHEIENWNASANSTVWVNVTSVSHTTDTLVLLYVNNSYASDGQNIPDVWDSNYVAVWHLNNTLDSTHGHNLTNYGASFVSGQAAYAADFEDTEADYLNAGTSNDFNFGQDGAFTWEYWMNMEALTGNPMCTFSTYATDGWHHTIDNSPKRFLLWGGIQRTYTYIPVISTWYYVVNNRPASDTAPSFYINGSLEGSYSGNTDFNNDGNTFNIGRYTTGSMYWDGILDEIRFSNVQRSAAWIKATYHSINQTPGFLTVGSPVFPRLSLWAYSPVTDSIDQNLTTITNVTINQSSGGNFDICWYTNTSGSWEMFAKNSGVTNGSYTQTNGNWNVLSTWYYWRVYVDDGTDNTTWGVWRFQTYTSPGNPINLSGDVGTGYVNISWVNNTDGKADNTTIVHNTTSYPTNPTDGTEIYNSSGNFYNDTALYSGYYTLYCYNSTSGLFSSGANLTWGGLTINVYDENTSNAIANWDVFITNETGTETYESLGNSNPLTIDISILPNGANVAVKINATDYDFRLYYMDIYANNQYDLDAYLAPENITELYLFSVIDELDNPVEDAKMEIKQYINDTVGYKDVSILYTDANGNVNVYLIPGSYNSLYKIIISKTGYDTEISDFVPSDSIFTHTFKLTFEDTEEPVTYVFWNVITFTGTAYNNGSIRVTYSDSSGLTTNTQFYMYSHYNVTDTLVDTETRTGENSITYWVTGLNLSRLHFVNLYFNHTYNFSETQPIKILILPINGTTNRTQLSFEQAITAVLGQNDLGWGNTIAFIVAIVLLCSFSPFQVGIGIIAAGAGLVAVQTMFVFNNIYILALIPIIVTIGIFYILATREPGGHL